jgi:hypothetical protein
VLAHRQLILVDYREEREMIYALETGVGNGLAPAISLIGVGDQASTSQELKEIDAFMQHKCTHA